MHQVFGRRTRQKTTAVVGMVHMTFASYPIIRVVLNQETFYHELHVFANMVGAVGAFYMEAELIFVEPPRRGWL